MDLLSLVEQDVSLRRAGAEYVGLCPFHQEKTPSFYVNPAKGLYLCRGCGEGGDAISWLRKKRGLTFREAARRCGKEISKGTTDDDRYRAEARTAILARFYRWQHKKLCVLNELLHDIFVAEVATRSILRAPELWTDEETTAWGQRLSSLYSAQDTALQDYARLCDEETAWNFWKEEGTP